MSQFEQIPTSLINRESHQRKLADGSSPTYRRRHLHINREFHQRKLVDGSSPSYRKHHPHKPRIPPTGVGGIRFRLVKLGHLFAKCFSQSEVF